MKRPLLPACLLLCAVAGCIGSGAARTLEPPRTWLDETGFEQRADWPSVVLHVQSDTIASWRGGVPGRLMYILENHPGITLRRPVGTGWGIHVREGNDEVGCDLPVYLNGSVMARGRSERRILSVDRLVNFIDVDAVEIHVGDGPVFDETLCGAVLIWSEAEADPSDLAFQGTLSASVTGSAADTVMAVTLEPIGVQRDMNERREVTFDRLPPGPYEVVYITIDGPIARRAVRVYAYFRSTSEIEIDRR